MSELRAAHAVLDSETHYVCAIRTGRHKLTADEPPHNGGTDTGPSPYDPPLRPRRVHCDHTAHVRRSQRLAAREVHVDLEMYKDEQTKTDRIVRMISFGGTLDSEQKAKLAAIAEKTPMTKTIKAGARIETKVL